jgi:hypothetical protein
VRRAGAVDVGLDVAADDRVGVIFDREDDDGDDGAAREGELGAAAGAGAGDGRGEGAGAAGATPAALDLAGLGATSPVSATAPSAGRYWPMESIRSVSRLASARSAASSESAAISSFVRDLLPVSHALATMRTSAAQRSFITTECFITREASRWHATLGLRRCS